MAKLVPGFVRKAVTKWKGLMRRDVGMEFEPIVEQKAGTSWNSHTQHLPGEDDDVEELDERDSGYASFEDTSSKTSSEGPPFSDNPSAVKYLQLPFKTKHYFLTYIQKILEATCVRYARKHLRGYLMDPDWKKIHLIFPFDDPPDRLVGRNWLAEDEIELLFWMLMFADCVPMPKHKRIFESIIDLRNAAVHRGDRGDLDLEQLYFAMALPALLGDEMAESEISNAFRYVIEDPTLDDGTKASAEFAIYSPQPCTTHYQVLARIQSMLEETCFNNAARTIPHVLTQNNWHTPEQIELQNWQGIFLKARISNPVSASDTFIFPGVDPSQCLPDLLGGARIHIRNIAAHRLPLSDDKLVTQVHRAINIALFLGDWQQAIEIEILAEMYFTKSSRAQVLERVESVFRIGAVESPYERGRRVAIAGVLAREEGRVMGVGEKVVVSETDDVVEPGRGGEWAVRTWSPSMHEGLKRREVL